MRITFFLDTLGAGGAERVASLLVDRWVTHGHDVEVITLSDPSDDFYELNSNVRRSSIGLLGPARSPLHGILLLVRRTWRIHRLLHRRQPDVVVSFVTRMNVLVLLACIVRPSLPVHVSERSNPELHPIPAPIARLRRLVYPRAQSVVAQTTAVAEWLERNVPRCSTIVIPNPVDLVPYSGDREPGLIVAAGSLEPRKGFDLLIRAFAGVARRCEGARLRIWGEGADGTSLRLLADNYGLRERIDFAGRYNDVAAAIGPAEVFVLSSRYEGFPNVLVEAMALGVTPVAFRCPHGPGEIIVDGESGLLVPPEDVDRLADALRAALDPAINAVLSDGALMSATRFQLETIGRRWDVLLGAPTGVALAEDE